MTGGLCPPESPDAKRFSLKTSAIYGRIYFGALCEEIVELIGLYINVISKIPNWNLRINMRDNLREVTICDFAERIYIWQIPRIKMKSFL